MDENSIHFEDFLLKLDMVEKRLQETSPNDPYLLEVFESFSNALEELRVATEELRQRNEELENSHRAADKERLYYQTLFDFAPDTHIVTDMDGNIQEINQAATIFGVEPYVIGKPLLLSVVQQDHKSFLRLLNEQKESRAERERELIMKPHKGTPFLALVKVSTLVDAQKKPYGLIWLIRNIEDRKRVQADQLEAEKQRLSNAYNRSLIEVSLDPLVTISLAGKITDVNNATERVTGRSREELIGTDFSEYFTDPQRARTGYQLAFEEGMVRDYELELRHQDGHITPVLYNASVFRDGTGQITGVFAAARDITERLHTEQQLRLQTTALESAANGVFITDKNGNIQWSNPAFSKMTGYATHEVFGKTPRILKSGNQDPQYYQEMWNTILSGQVWQGELINRRKDGTEYFEEQTIAPVFDKEGKVTHFVAVKQDITSRKQVEDQIRKEATRSQVLSEVSRALSEAGQDYQAVINRDSKANCCLYR